MSEHDPLTALAHDLAATLAGLVAGFRHEGDDYDGSALLDVYVEGLSPEGARDAVRWLSLAAARQLAATDYETPDEGDL